MKNAWFQSGSNFSIDEVTSQLDKLPVAIYKLQYNELVGKFYLTRISEKFEFSYKLYNIETDFVTRVKKTWDNTDGNMGILLNGIKGTGKTVTAELICNNMNQPVIIIPTPYKGLTNFLNELQQDCTIFIDEYDKIFDKYSNSLLTVMDGVLKTNSRLLFLLTSNNQWLEQNMTQRPSRIRYIKQYGDLPLETIIEVVDDMLIHKHHRKDTIAMIATLPIITMDLVKSVIQEVNIHDENPETFRSYFNVNGEDERKEYNVYYINAEGEKVLHTPKAVINLRGIKPGIEGHDFRIESGRPTDGHQSGYQGEVAQVVGENQFIVEVRVEETVHQHESIVQQLLDEADDVQPSQERIEYYTDRMFILEPITKQHSMFNAYAF
jgi:SpoVK/Ycf46/Vps4 family AAA+-type ATPase